MKEKPQDGSSNYDYIFSFSFSLPQATPAPHLVEWTLLNCSTFQLYSVVWMYHRLFSHSPICGHLGCFQYFEIIKMLTASNLVDIILIVLELYQQYKFQKWNRQVQKVNEYVVFLDAAENKIIPIYHKNIYQFLYHKNYTNLHFYQPSACFFISLPTEYVAHQRGGEQQLSMVLICLYLMNEVELFSQV